MRGYLALVGPRVSPLCVLDLQLPVVGLLQAQAVPVIIAVGVKSPGEQFNLVSPIFSPHPRNRLVVESANPAGEVSRGAELGRHCGGVLVGLVEVRGSGVSLSLLVADVLVAAIENRTVLPQGGS